MDHRFVFCTAACICCWRAAETRLSESCDRARVETCSESKLVDRSLSICLLVLLHWYDNKRNSAAAVSRKSRGVRRSVSSLNNNAIHVDEINSLEHIYAKQRVWLAILKWYCTLLTTRWNRQNKTLYSHAFTWSPIGSSEKKLAYMTEGWRHRYDRVLGWVLSSCRYVSNDGFATTPTIDLGLRIVKRAMTNSILLKSIMYMRALRIWSWTPGLFAWACVRESANTLSLSNFFKTNMVIVVYE